MNATGLIKPFNLTALGVNVRFRGGLCLTEATALGNARSVHVAEWAADAIATSCPVSSDPTASDSAEFPSAAVIMPSHCVNT